jgi:hypothetical protein
MEFSKRGTAKSRTAAGTGQGNTWQFDLLSAWAGAATIRNVSGLVPGEDDTSYQRNRMFLCLASVFDPGLFPTLGISADAMHS